VIEKSHPPKQSRGRGHVIIRGYSRSQKEAP
jgi:hypothetical protein